MNEDFEKETSDDYFELLRQPRGARLLEKRSPVLKRLLDEHNLTDPKSVEFSPVRSADFKRCFVNVEQQVQRAGGRMETGWIFWEFEGTSVFTEAHAIWITPQNRRVDITPQRFPPDRRILFLPDPSVASLRGVTVGYKTILSSDPRVIKLEKFHSEIDRILAEVFPGFGVEYVFPVQAIRESAQALGLPSEVADYHIAVEFKKNEENRERYGDK